MTVRRRACGTQYGLRQHFAAGELACDACLAWNRDKVRRYRRKTSSKCARGLGWPLRSNP
jgi:hypothetical protein